MPRNGPRDNSAPTSHVDAADERTQSLVLRALLWTFIALTAAIALIGIASGSYDKAAISATGTAVYGLLLLGMNRMGPRLTGYLCTAWYFLLALAAMAAGRGVNDITMVLFPAGMFMGALLLRQSHLVPLIVLTVAAVAAVGAARLASAGGATVDSVAEVVVVSLLLLVAGVLTRLVVRSLQAMVAERLRAEEEVRHSKSELEARNQSLQLVNELAHRLHRSLDIATIAHETVDVLVRRNRPPMVAFFLLDPEAAELRMIADHGFTTEVREIGGTLPLEGSLSGLALREQRLVTTDDLEHDQNAQPDVRAALARRGVTSGISIPLVFGGNPLGTVNMLMTERQTFTPADLDTFQAIGQAVSLAITNARHFTDLEHQAFHDSLTALPNRAELHRRFTALLPEHGDASRIGLVLLDLNRFREINDALGHHVGDQLLVLIGSRLAGSHVARPSDVFRLGGDEFAVLLPGLADATEAEARAGLLRASLGAPFEVAGMALDVGASLGVAVYPDHGRDSHQLLRCADVAMYRAKRTAGGVAGYSSEFDEHTPERLSMMSDLGRAIRDGELTLHFQPKVALHTGSVVGFEALVRWQHPRLGLLHPADFLPMAEAGDAINPLTYWVVENALAQLGRWNRRFPGLTMAINLSVRNLLDRNCSDRVEEIMRAAGVEPSLVEFELTETAIMTDPESVLTMLGRLTATGARLAIDDFGTGYSSLTYLKRFPVHVIKIDRSFVSEMATREQSHAIVRSTIQLARSLGLTVVAEGIEDRETATSLRDIGCDLAQGFYFARPLPAGEIGDLSRLRPLSA